MLSHFCQPPVRIQRNTHGHIYSCGTHKTPTAFSENNLPDHDLTCTNLLTWLILELLSPISKRLTSSIPLMWTKIIWRKKSLSLDDFKYCYVTTQFLPKQQTALTTFYLEATRAPQTQHFQNETIFLPPLQKFVPFLLFPLSVNPSIHLPRNSEDLGETMIL